MARTLLRSSSSGHKGRVKPPGHIGPQFFATGLRRGVSKLVDSPEVSKRDYFQYVTSRFLTKFTKHALSFFTSLHFAGDESACHGHAPRRLQR